MAISLEKELARQMARHGKPVGVVAAVLTKYTPGTRTPGSEGSGTNPTSSTHRCRAYVEETEQSYVEGTTSKQTKATVGIFGSSIEGGVVPAINDKVTIKGVTYRLAKVIGDGVGAVYEFEGS